MFRMTWSTILLPRGKWLRCRHASANSRCTSSQCRGCGTRAFLVKEFNDPNAANGIRHAILTSAPKAADLILARAKAHHDSGIEYASMTLSEDHFRKVLGDIYRRCTAERNRMDSAPGADASASV